MLRRENAGLCDEQDDIGRRGGWRSSDAGNGPADKPCGQRHAGDADRTEPCRIRQAYGADSREHEEDAGADGQDSADARPARASAPLARALDGHARVNGDDEWNLGSRHDGMLRRCYAPDQCPRRSRSDDARSNDGWTDDGLVQLGRRLLEADARANEAAAVHDRPVLGDAADDDESDDVAPTLDDGAATAAACSCQVS